MDREDKKKLQKEKEKISKYKRDLKKKVANDPKIKCTFVNLESPGVSLDFTYENEGYHFDDGTQYDIRIGVIEHLNGLKVPVRQYKTDPRSGQLIPETEIVAWKNRFSVTPVDMGKYVEGMKSLNESDNQ
jgi:hypothetical protein